MLFSKRKSFKELYNKDKTDSELIAVIGVSNNTEAHTDLQN